MVRLFLRLIGIKDFEDCKSCEVLKQQLLLANENNKELTSTLLGLIKPKVYEAPAVTVPAFAASASTFSKRREMLEQTHRKRDEIISSGKFVAKADGVSNVNPAGSAQSISSLEEELGIGEDNATQKSN